MLQLNTFPFLYQTKSSTWLCNMENIQKHIRTNILIISTITVICLLNKRE